MAFQVGLDVVSLGAVAYHVFTGHAPAGNLFELSEKLRAGDGLELAQRCHSRWPYVKVIVTSGAVRVRPADVPDGGRFLAKPYSLAELTRTVSELAGRPQQATLSLH